MDLSAALRRKAEELRVCRGSGRDAALRNARRVRRGVYCVDPLRQPSFEEAVVAALLVLPAGTVAYGLTAARLWRLDALVPVALDEPLEFLVPGRSDSARLSGCILHFAPLTGVALPLGIPSTSRSRAVVDVITNLPFADAVALVEAANRGDPELSFELAEERRRRLPRRSGGHVARVLDFAGSLSESVLESHARVLWAMSGLPVPLQQAAIRVDGRFVARVDFLWPAARLIVEVDGLAKYAEPGELQREKARQNTLIAAGYTVMRFTWHDIHHRADAVVRMISTKLCSPKPGISDVE
jgi:very-short-patch-repair endonuclease